MKSRKLSVTVLCLAVMVALASCLSASASMHVRTFVENGQTIDEVIIDGHPPDNFRAPAVVVPQTDATSGIVTLANVPAFDWCYGCSATSSAMMMGYYDNNGYPNMYAGPANGGVCPLTNTVWGYGQCPLSATKQGLDGRNLRGHVDDYWKATNNCDPDPYIAGPWTEHTQGDCLGDYMGTNQSKYSNCDGATTFYYDTSGGALYDYTGAEPARRDGCHGLKLFAQSRGYTVSANYSQYIYGYNGNTTGFTYANYQSEINAGRPVLIQVDNHTMLGYGYDSSSQTIYVHDTWDHYDHSMTWGGSYSGLAQYGVTVLRLTCQNPVITTQPAGGAYCPGQGVSFSVIATGVGLTYQWRKNTANISGATTSSYGIPSVAVGDAGNYDCVVSNSCGSTTSTVAVLTVCTTPVITANPTDQAVFTGNSATFTVTATGGGLSYQWQVSTDGGANFSNVTNGSGGTTASYTTAPTSAADDGEMYRCVVTGPCSPAITSTAAKLSLVVGVALLSEGFESPFVNGAPPGWTKEFSSLTVDWVRNVGDHSGGTAEDGTYNAMLYSSSSTSHKTYLVTPVLNFTPGGAAATLEFWHKQAPVGTKQDTLEIYYRTVAGGAWTVLAGYSGPATTWTKRTITLPNLTKTYYIGFLGTARAGNGACIDNVVVTQGCIAPSITAQPTPVDTCAGASVSFAVTANGSGLSYQWRKDGTNLSGATAAGLTINPVGVSDAGNYDCVVSNGCTSVASAPATLTVSAGPIISGQPSDTPIWVGGSVTFSVGATGKGTLTYQWRKDGSSIGGATGASYTIPSAALSDSGGYDCVVSDDCGLATSGAAYLAVVTPTATAAAVKLLPDGQLVALVRKPITLANTDYFYVEESDRSAGIRVEKPGHRLGAGSCADLVGVLTTNGDGERLIAASAAVADGTGSAAAVAMGNKLIGGTDWLYNGTAHTGQMGAYGMKGLNNIGLLVKTWGAFAMTDDTSFTLDDGSGSPIACLVEPGVALSSTWQYASVLGVSSMYKVADGVYSPKVLVREIHAY